MIQRIRDRLRYENDYIRVFDDDVRFDDGSYGSYVRIETAARRGPGVVCGVVHGGRYALVRSFRYPIGAYEWAFPRGFGDVADGDVMTTARRECKEELGQDCDVSEVIGWIAPDSGLLAIRTAVVKLIAAAPTTLTQDPVEIAEIKWLTPEEVVTEIKSGRIEDAYTIAAAAMLGFQFASR